MSIRALSRAEVRSIDAIAADEFGLPTIVLMENAGRGAAERLRARLAPGDCVFIACGPGNNGGDGGVVARHLDAWGFTVHVVWFADPARLPRDAATQHAVLSKAGVAQTVRDAVPPSDADADAGPWPWADAADWWVDALLGTGLTRAVEGRLASAIAGLNRSGRPVLALDVPSGLDADTGEPLGAAVRATFTATFVAPKLGFGSPGASDYTGAIEVVEIGVPRRLLTRFEGA